MLKPSADILGGLRIFSGVGFQRCADLVCRLPGLRTEELPVQRSDCFRSLRRVALKIDVRRAAICVPHEITGDGANVGDTINLVPERRSDVPVGNAAGEFQRTISDGARALVITGFTCGAGPTGPRGDGLLHGLPDQLPAIPCWEQRGSISDGLGSAEKDRQRPRREWSSSLLLVLRHVAGRIETRATRLLIGSEPGGSDLPEFLAADPGQRVELQLLAKILRKKRQEGPEKLKGDGATATRRMPRVARDLRPRLRTGDRRDFVPAFRDSPDSLEARDLLADRLPSGRPTSFGTRIVEIGW